MQTGDIILSYNDEPIDEMRDLPRVVANSVVGERFKMEVWRDGKIRNLNITTDRFPDDDAVASLVSPDTAPLIEDNDAFGANLSELTEEYRREFNITENVSGLVVLDVNNNGLAALNGIRSGDVITSMNNVKVNDVDDVADILEDAKKEGREKIVVLLQRNTGSRFIPFNLSDR